MDKKAIRLEILEFYYKKGLRECTDCRDFMDLFDMSVKELQNHIWYLNEKKFIKCKFTLEGVAFCRITSYGMDVIENPEQFLSEFPALNLIIQGNVYDSQILQGKNIKIDNGFNRVYQAIEKSDLNSIDKKELCVNVKELELEASKKNPDSSRIKSILDIIKSKSPNIYSLLNPLVIEYLKKAIGLD